jgi:3-oxoadipate enol-lactonase
MAFNENREGLRVPLRLVANGGEIAFRLEGPAQAPVVIFANGLGMDLSMWSPQVAAFTQGYQVLRYDLRGHGGSPSTLGKYSLAMLASDILTLMDGLNIASAHLVGTSLGAMVGQQLAISHPGRLLSLTLCATTVEPPRDAWRKRIDDARVTGLAPQVDGIIDRWFLPSFATRRPDVVQRMRDILLGTDLAGYLGCASAIRDMDIAGSIHAIPHPTLVLAGDADLVTPRRDLEQIAEHIPGARLVDVADCAHLPTIEQPDSCNRAILSFFEEIASRPSLGVSGRAGAERMSKTGEGEAAR